MVQSPSIWTTSVQTSPVFYNRYVVATRTFRESDNKANLSYFVLFVILVWYAIRNCQRIYYKCHTLKARSESSSSSCNGNQIDNRFQLSAMIRMKNRRQICFCTKRTVSSKEKFYCIFFNINRQLSIYFLLIFYLKSIFY